jgi:hypothetical protein
MTKMTRGTRKYQQLYLNENNKQKVVPLILCDDMIL